MLSQSYNDWLRAQSLSSSLVLEKNTATLLVSLQALQFQLQQEITMGPSQVSRVIVAMEHLLIEIRLLDTSSPSMEEQV